jgi:hypothetical protein
VLPGPGGDGLECGAELVDLDDQCADGGATALLVDGAKVGVVVGRRAADPVAVARSATSRSMRL